MKRLSLLSLFSLLGLAVALLPATSVRAGDDLPGAGEIEALVKQLGDEDYARRQEASKRLLEIGEPARAALQRTMKQGDDMEARWRAEQILRRLDQTGEKPMSGRQLDDGARPIVPLPEPPPAPPPSAPGAPGVRPVVPPLGGQAGSDLQRMLERFAALRGTMDRLFPRTGRPLEERKLLEAPGLVLEITTFGSIPRAVLSLKGTSVAPGLRRDYRGRSLDAILAYHPELAALAGMDELKTKWVAFKRARPDLFAFDDFLSGRGFGGGFGGPQISVQTGSSGVEVRQVGDHVEVKIHETNAKGERETQTFEGATVEEIKKAHPEIADSIPDFHTLGPTQFFRSWPRPRRTLPVLPPVVTPGVVAPAVTFGIHVRKVDPVLSSQLRLEEGQGLLVEEVEVGSQAEGLGLERYDIILTINGEPVTDLDRGVLVLRATARDDAPVRLGIIRRGESQTLQR